MKVKPSLDELEIRTAAIVDPNLLYVLLEDRAMASRDAAHTVVGVWQRDKDWLLLSLKYNGVSIAVKPGAPGVRQVVIVGSGGEFTVSAGGKATTGEVASDTELASARLVDGTIMAVGIAGGVFRMTSPTAWDDVTDARVEENVEAICAHPAGGFLVSGWQGLVAHHRDGGVKRVKTGVDVILTDIICDDEGEIVACGQRGTLLRGTTDGLVPVEIAGVTDDFWSVAKFRDEVYVASTTALYKLADDDALQLVTFQGKVVPTSFYHLDTHGDSLMLSTGRRDVVLFDGKEWSRIL